MLVWSLFYISDYALTLKCARLYAAQQTIRFEGSYELTPYFQRDIDSLRVVSPRFLFALLLTLGMLGFLWLLNKQSSAPFLWQFILGCLICVQLAVHTRHLRSLFLFRSINSTNFVQGRIEYARSLSLRMSSWECFGFSGFFLVLFAFTRSWFILGGVVQCFAVGINTPQAREQISDKARRTYSIPGANLKHRIRRI